MNIHEYQAKELFDQFNVPTARGKVASTADEARAAASGLASGAKLVVKSQIHAGGRGKGVFKSGFKGGVKLCDTPDEAAELASQMLGQVLVTHQTGPEGKLVSKVLIAQAVDIAKEYYFAILLDRATSAPVLVASTEGGVNIEEVAEHTPEKIIRMSVAPSGGLQGWQARKLARQLGFANKQMLAAAKVFQSLYKLFVTCDCSMVEINPLALTTSGEVLALDAKFGFDESALFRHPDIFAMRDVTEEDPREVEASKFGLNYVGLDGSIGCLVNGAGLAMATMDIIKYSGGSPANFLDVGGGATEEQVTQAFGILMADPNVKAILVNIFGGIMRCDVIAQGIINAALKLSLSIPLIVRLEGNRVSEGKALLQSSGLNLIAADHLADAAEKAVAAVNQAA